VSGFSRTKAQMKKSVVLVIVFLGCTAVGGMVLRAAGLPLWAYGYKMDPPAPDPALPTCTAERPFACARRSPPPDDGTLRHIEGSKLSFPIKQIHAEWGPADWFPEDHPAMPDIVAHGREKDGVSACALCHYPNGLGKPENAPVAGVSVGYFMNQMSDFKEGLRRSADPRKVNVNEMAAIAGALTAAETKAAAEYFASITFKPWIKVVEAEMVPKFSATLNGLFQPAKGADTEPLGQRLIEIPQDSDETFLNRNPRSGFVAYVPPGTLKKGEALVTTGGTRTTGCAVCHGPDLRGVGDTPPIAGRQASYVARQLYDMQQGTRRGFGAELMKSVVSDLDEQDILAIAAYVASREP
jgi:cytochrome c553